MGHNVKNLYQ